MIPGVCWTNWFSLIGKIEVNEKLHLKGDGWLSWGWNLRLCSGLYVNIPRVDTHIWTPHIHMTTNSATACIATKQMHIIYIILIQRFKSVYKIISLRYFIHPWLYVAYIQCSITLLYPPSPFCLLSFLFPISSFAFLSSRFLNRSETRY